jgi:hypothetical protein
MSRCRSVMVFLGLSVCAGGCAVSATGPEAGSSDMVIHVDDLPRQAPAEITVSTGPAVTTDNVIDWTARGVGDGIIINRIHQTHSVFHLSAEQEGKLRDAGVSTTVVRAMDATNWDTVDGRSTKPEMRSNAE